MPASLARLISVLVPVEKARSAPMTAFCSRSSRRRCRLAARSCIRPGFIASHDFGMNFRSRMAFGA